MVSKKSQLPKHVALIVDGNRRWAKNRDLDPKQGHIEGIKKILPKIIDHAILLGIDEITIWLFSTENWDRSVNEVKHLMILFQEYTEDLKKYSAVNKIQITHVGRKDRLPKTLLNNLVLLENNTKKYHKKLNLCIDYGGRDEISRAIGQLFKSGIKECVTPELITEFVRKENHFLNPPELIIRTGGDQRVSGFMTWDGAYAELAFEKKCFPDFTPELFEKHIVDFSLRHRRFGK